MATVNQICSSIIDVVNNSSLDFQINQTPYSIHFSIRKKFIKNFNPVTSESSATKNHLEDPLQLELLHVRNEYVKLYNLYETEKNCRSKLNEDYKEVLETIAATVTAGHNLQEQKSETV